MIFSFRCVSGPGDLPDKVSRVARGHQMQGQGNLQPDCPAAIGGAFFAVEAAV
jgi:hypothetical protein